MNLHDPANIKEILASYLRDYGSSGYDREGFIQYVAATIFDETDEALVALRNSANRMERNRDDFLAHRVPRLDPQKPGQASHQCQGSVRSDLYECRHALEEFLPQPLDSEIPWRIGVAALARVLMRVIDIIDRPGRTADETKPETSSHP